MLVVSVLSLKGGVGKTSVVLGLAGAAMGRGLHVLVLDLDPQGNATTVLDPTTVRFTANDVLADGRPRLLNQAITTTGWGAAVDVVASEPALALRAADGGSAGEEHRLRTALQGLAGYDLVVIDCPPSIDVLTRAALAASRLALVVTEPTLFSVTGAHRALEAVDEVRRGFNLQLRPAGLVVNRYREVSAEHRYRLAELRTAYPGLVLEPVLPERAAVQQAQGAGVPVQGWPSRGAKDIRAAHAAHLDRLLELGRKAARPLDRPDRKGGRRR